MNPSKISSHPNPDLDAETEQDLGAEVLHLQLKGAGHVLGERIALALQASADRLNLEVSLSEQDLTAFIDTCQKLLPSAIGSLLAEIGSEFSPLNPTDYSIGRLMATKALELSVMLMQATDECEHRRLDWEKHMVSFLKKQGISVPAGVEAETK